MKACLERRYGVRTDPIDAQHCWLTNWWDIKSTSRLSGKPGSLERVNCVREALALPSFRVVELRRRASVRFAVETTLTSKLIDVPPKE